MRTHVLPAADTVCGVTLAFPDWTMSSPFVAANALWVMAALAGHLPDSGMLPKEALRACVAAMGAADVETDDDYVSCKPVRVSACHALCQVLECQFGQDELRPVRRGLLVSSCAGLEARDGGLERVLRH